MRKYLTAILLLILYQQSSGQDKSTFSNHQVTVDFGSFRNLYPYPVTDLGYGSPVLKTVSIKFSIRIRSYGTLIFYSKSAYDITTMAEYYFTKTRKPLCFSAGFGLDSRIRLVHDERSEATSSIEPLVSVTIYGYYGKFSMNLPFWTRFYSNGISFMLLPELSYQIGKRVSCFLRYELSYLTIYNTPAHEWRQDCFIGTHILF